MCGIAGFYNLDGAPADAHTLSRMVEVQRHRGPDDQGMRLFSLRGGRSREYGRAPAQAPDPGLEGALGFNRLSILDLSEQGHQPMANADGTILVAFNGEIYNAFQYTAELQRAGFRFRSRTDTEVILYLYEQHGLEGMLERLNGMFVIVVVDLRRREVNIARDHLGVKPLYWCQAGNTVLFASEVKSFLAHPAFLAELDQARLDEYIAFRYCAGENHLLKGVRQLRPGHWLRVSPDGLTVRRYWEIPDRSSEGHESPAAVVDQLAQLLRESVRSQLLADVKVGCQLSGGIDSSQVTLLAREQQADIDTFSIVFQDPAYSEDRWISRVADKAGVDNHRFIFTRDAFVDSIERATWHMDQPISHPNSLGILLLAQRARRLVTVLLSGEGADELMGGYTRFFDAALQQALGPWLPLLDGVPGLGRRLRGDCGPGDPVTSFVTASLFQSLGNLQRLRPDSGIGPALELRREIFREGRGDHLGNCMKYEMQTYMVDLLVRQDKMTMAHSIENRVPFLDRNLVGFVRQLSSPHLVAAGLPLGPAAKTRGTKITLKELAKRSFGHEFVYRTKQGFGLPLVHCFGDRRFRQMMGESILPGIRRRGWLNPTLVEGWWSSLSTLSEMEIEGLWICVALELWAQRFLDRAGDAPVVAHAEPSAVTSVG